jgi:hypothetical protein
VAEKDCCWEWWQPCSLLSLYHLQIVIADHARIWYVHPNYNILCHTVRPGSRTNLYLFNWRCICHPTCVTVVGDCTQRILYLVIEDTSVNHAYMRIWWTVQPLITKFCFSESQHISIVAETTNLQLTWRKLMNHWRRNPQQQNVSPLCNSLDCMVQGKAISVEITKSYSSMVVYSSSRKIMGDIANHKINWSCFWKW